MKPIWMRAMFIISAFAFPALRMAEEFPLRAKYKDVPVIELATLKVEYDKVIIVDVRSQFEFDVIHITKAKHTPMAKRTFTKDLEGIRSKTGAQKMVFYCNGHTCAKSYKATARAIKEGFKNVFAFDAGVFDWVNEYPDKGSLLGVSPVSKAALIPKIKLKERSLSAEAFAKATTGANAMVIDIRDPIQRKKMPTFANIKNIPLDRLKNMIVAKQFKKKHLLIFDAVGKQIRWLQYYLEKYGYQNYNFLTKGVAGLEAGQLK